MPHCQTVESLDQYLDSLHQLDGLHYHVNV